MFKKSETLTMHTHRTASRRCRALGRRNKNRAFAVTTRLPVLVCCAIMLAVTGCNPISIAPTCPNTLRVDESGPVTGNVINPGGIPEFLWEAFPEGAGSFANPTLPDTTFTPAFEGDVIVRLTASDGFFQVVSQCVISVEGILGPAIEFEADPAAALIGEEVTLTCASAGTDPINLFAVTQTDGGDVTLTDGDEPGTATFTPTEIGDLTFRCVGETEDGAQTEPAFIIVNVNQTEPPDLDGDRAGGGRI